MGRQVLTGSVVGIQFEVVTMYTGTLINDLMKTAERITSLAELQIKEELHEIFAMQIPVTENEPVYQGAA
jgi:hypothetical protein